MRYQLRRTRLFAERLGLTLLVVTAAIDMGELVGRLQGIAFTTFDTVVVLLSVVFLAAAMWPVRVLAVTPRILRIRERLVLSGARFGGARTSTRLRTIDWSDVVEVLLASRDDRVTMIVAYREPRTGLRAAATDLPIRDEREVADAISRVAPGVVIRQAHLPDILIRTSQPYVFERWTSRAQALGLALTVLGGGIVAAVLTELHLETYRAWPVAILLVVAGAWLRSPRVFVSPEQVLVTRWWPGSPVPWTSVRWMRLAAAGDTGELTVCAGDRTRTHRLPDRAGLSEVDAVLRAYAPPHVLNPPGAGA